MRRFVLPVSALIVFSLIGSAQDARSERVVQQLDEMLRAMLAHDYARAVDLTHTKVVQYLGGREKAMAAFQSGANSIHSESGITPISSKPESPLGLWVGGSDLFTIVPVTDRFRMSRGRVVSKTHYIAVSSDSGKTWSFASILAFQGENGPRLKEFFPNWPSDLVLPPRERARLEPNQ